VAKDGRSTGSAFPVDPMPCFAALLGTPDNGRWKIAPEGEVARVRRSTGPAPLILETEFETPDGAGHADRSDAHLRPGHRRGPHRRRTIGGPRAGCGWSCCFASIRAIVPWVRAIEGGIEAVAGPDASG